jgi:UDP-N-acetylmuramyl pentapeptide phosphotransferase/UDP-N-acetylglucosamine-1-phosphate transferase
MKIRGFILLAIGVVGLLVNEFDLIWTHSSKVTIIFAVIAAAGLAYLVWAWVKARG